MAAKDVLKGIDKQIATLQFSRIIAEIDLEIEKLQKVKALLSGNSPSVAPVVKTGKRGRPKGSKNVRVKTTAKAAKRTMSPEARKRIADAQKARWAKARG